MPHCDEETLSLFALGEPAPAGVEEHLASCPHCESELAALRLVVTAARDVIADGLTLERTPPPTRVWEQIAAETGVRVNARQSEVIRHASARPATRPWLPAAARPRTRVLHRVQGNGPVRPRGATAGAGAATGARRNRIVPAVAAGCLIAGLLLGGFGERLLIGGPAPAAPVTASRLVVAQTALAGLALAPTADGQADVVKTAQGRQLDLDVHQLAAPNGFYEVWLIDPTITKMVAIGVLSGGRGQFSLPTGVDLKNYPLVDISIQPLDGDPKHSGRSVLRGTLKS